MTYGIEFKLIGDGLRSAITRSSGNKLFISRHFLQFFRHASGSSCCEFATLWTATNENKSSVANVLSNHPLLSLFRLHVSSSTSGWLAGVREKLNAASILVTRHVQRIVSSHSSRIFSFTIFARILVIAYSCRTREMRRAREFGDDSSPTRLRLNWISSRSINGRMETNSRCSISRMLPSGIELEAYNPIFN